ncbi:MAG: protein arginine kinase [Clostridiales bacterium]|nr:protein arginine kinase [Clostridiales bacterium]
MIWYKDNDADIAVSTRIRLARNVEGTPFPNALSDKGEVTEKIKNAVLASNSTLAGEFEFINLDQKSKTERSALAEEHLISPQMISGKGQSVMISRDKTMSIMLMEEDHIRLQIIQSGLALSEAYETANRVDDVIEESLAYAFDEEFGYLTACPTNAGTGMRASVMLHLPALRLTDNISRIISSVNAMGLTVRGLYGEGTKAYGDMYQISNQVTLGLSEREIINKLKSVVDQIIDLEKKAREGLMKANADYLKDKLGRSYGILKYAFSMSSKEARELISDVILGQNLGILKKGKMSALECMVKASPAEMGGQKPEERDLKRAQFLKENI